MQHLLEKCSVEYMKFCVEYICWFENCAYKRKLQYSCIIKKGSLFSHMGWWIGGGHASLPIHDETMKFVENQ